MRKLYLEDNLGTALALERCRAKDFATLTQVKKQRAVCIAREKRAGPAPPVPLPPAVAMAKRALAPPEGPPGQATRRRVLEAATPAPLEAALPAAATWSLRRRVLTATDAHASMN